ncbi:MAG TPA: PAS domain-containing protein [Methylomirabilota bacterium]|nr:PAS domain-containing protein [Methylomirabilota bacterium]
MTRKPFIWKKAPCLWLWVVVGLFSPSIFGQAEDEFLASVERLDSPWRIRSFTEDAGLTRRNVFGAAFEPNGNIWVAGSDAVYFSDGYSWKRYTTADGLPTDFIRSVYVARDGVVWVGTAKGLAIFKQGKFQAFGAVSDLAGPSVRRIAEDPDGTMWFCSDRWPDPSLPGGITSFKQGKWRKHTTADGLPSDHVLNYFRSSNGRQYALTTKGAARRDGDRWIPLGAPGIPRGEEAWEMAESPKWGLFLQTQNHLLRWNGSQWEQQPRPLSPLMVTRSGDLLTFQGGAEGTHFLQWDGKQFKQVALIPRTFTYAEAVVEAPDGGVWALGYNNLVRWSRRGAEWTEYRNLPLPSLVDSKDRVWLTGEEASLVFDGEKAEWTPVLKKNVVSSPSGVLWGWTADGVVTALNSTTNVYGPSQTGVESAERLLINDSGNPWLIGKNKEGQVVISRFENQAWQPQFAPELEGKNVMEIHPDLKGGFWFITGPMPRELIHINGSAVRHEISLDFTTHADPRFAVSKEGLWMFGNFGLYRLNESLSVWEKIPNIRNNIFAALVHSNSICFLFDGNTGGRSGYLSYRNGQFTPVYTDVSEFSAALSGGHLLISEGRGLTMLDAATHARLQHLTLPIEAGILSVVRRANGELWLGCNNGSTLRYRSDELPPSTQVVRSQRTVEHGGRLRAEIHATQRYRPRQLVAEYKFSWRFDNGPWSAFAAFPSEGFPVDNLAPGKHVLEVRARDEGLHVDPNAARIEFTVLPLPLQSRPWFWAAASGFMLLLVGSTLVAVRRAEAHKAANRALRAEMEQREAAQRALLEERRLLEGLMNSVPDKIFFKDKDGKFLRINQSMAEMFKLGHPQEAIGKTDFDFFTEVEARRAFMDEQQIIRTGTGLIGQEETFNSTGGLTWVSATKMPLRNAAGETIGVVGISRDITQRKEAELEMERQRVEYQTIFDTVPALVIYKNSENRILRANRYTAKFWARSPDEIAGRSVADLDARHGRGFDEADASVMASGTPMYGTVDQVEVRSGESRWLRVDRIPYRDVHGAIIGVIIFAVDVTERRLATEALRKAKEELEVRVEERTAELLQANAGLQREIAERGKVEDELRRAESFLKSVLENLPTAVFIKDAKTLKFVLMNKFNQELTGRTEEQVLGKGDYDLFSPEQAAAFVATDRQVIASGALQQTEEPLDTPHHGRRILQTKKIPVFNSKGEPQYLVGISEDVTEQRLAEQELKQAKEAAEAASRAKSDFLANMSHEIRTPMNAIIGMTNLLLDTPLASEQRDYVETVRGSGEALLTIINDILDFSKIESGKLTFEHIPFDLREIVESSVDFLAERARSKQIELACLVETNVWTHVKGDPGRLRQILANLISNAVKFTEKGEVFVRVSLESNEQARQRIRVEVKDTGIGISKAAQERLFQPFSQADSSTTRKYGGTGLGLVISRKLVTLMGGDIGISSEPGRGSTFWFTAVLEKEATATPSFAADHLAGLRVLIVDDNETNRLVLKHQLNGWRMAHGAAPGAAEALQELRRAAETGSSYHLAILDMQMPEMDGLALARAIKLDPKLGSTRTILLTSLGDRLPPDKMTEVGLSASLLKPIRQSELFNCLATVSGGSTLPTRHVAIPAEAAPKGTRNLRVLLVEDNAVNQKVSVQQLRKLGYTADVAGNGHEAIEAWRRMHYDVILMDCQMPEMDGYEATRQIRVLEAKEGPAPLRPHVYVIALTANALKGDREKCLEAGMDDYISKPVRIAELEEAINRAVDALSPLSRIKSKAGANDAAATLNCQTIQGLRELALDGGFDPLAELAPLFVEDSKSLLRRIEAALEAEDSNAVKHSAHALKGSSRNLGADRLGRLCESLEKQALACNWTVARALATQIAAELELVHQALSFELGKAAARN